MMRRGGIGGQPLCRPAQYGRLAVSHRIGILRVDRRALRIIAKAGRRIMDASGLAAFAAHERHDRLSVAAEGCQRGLLILFAAHPLFELAPPPVSEETGIVPFLDRKSTRLNSSH